MCWFRRANPIRNPWNSGTFTALPGATTTFALNGGLISSTNDIGRSISGATTIGGNIGIGNLPGAAGLMAFSNTINLTGGTRTLTIGSGGATFSGVVSNGGLIKEGTGNLLLSGSAVNTFTGDVTVNEGMVIIGKSGAFGAANTAATKVTVASGAAVDLNGRGGVGAEYGFTISGTGIAGTGALVNNGVEISTSSRQVSNIKLAADASIGGSGNWAMLAPGFGANTIDLARHTLTKVGANTITLVTTTTTAGAIHVTGGGISFGATNANFGVTGSASSLVLDNTAGVSLIIAKNSSIGSLAGGSTTGGGINLIDGNRTLTIGALNTNTEYAGPISNTAGSLSITKVGSGTQIFFGTNTYTGATNADGGRLIIDGSISTSSLTTVKSGATLGGSGSVGALSVLGGGKLAPGSSAGELTITNGLGLAGILDWELGALSTSNPGSEYNRILVTSGDVDITGASLGLNLGLFAPSDTPFWQVNQTWAGILDNTGAGTLTGFFAAIDNSAWSSRGAFTTTYTNNDVNLVWTAVPEPTGAFLIGGLGVLSLFRRRR